jgi:hypothetical protein
MIRNQAIQFLTNDQIDKKRWDQTMESSHNGNAYGYSWYLDAVFPSWSALVTEDYKYIFPLTINKKFGLSYWYSPIYTMQLGIFSQHILTEELVNSFYTHLPKNIVSFDFSVNPGHTVIPNGFSYKLNTCQFVDLSLSYIEIKSNYSNNSKRSIKKAISSNLQIKESTDIDSVVKMFQQFRGDSLNVNELEYNKLKQLIANSFPVGSGKIYHVLQDNQVLAACFFSFTNKRIIYHKGGVNETGKKLGAMHFLIDYLIRENSESNLTLDFGGSSIPAVKRFNQNFGNKEYTYYQLQKGGSLINFGRKLKNKLFQ